MTETEKRLKCEAYTKYKVEGTAELRRGAVWFIDRGDLFVRRAIAVVFDRKNEITEIVDAWCSHIATVEDVIDEWYEDAIDVACGLAIDPVDGVPWEIHRIENEEAHQAALEAYKKAL